MTTHSAVGINDDLASRKSGVTLRPTDDETSSWVDEEFGCGVEEIFWNDLANDIGDDEAPDFFIFHVLGVLGRDDHVGHTHGLAAFIQNRHLALGIRTKPFHLAGLANRSELTSETMGEHDRSRHEFGCFVASEAEHETLVTRALLVSGFAFGFLRVNALRDVRALAGEEVRNENSVSVEDIVVIRVSDATDGFANDAADVEYGVESGTLDLGNRDLATDDYGVALNESLAGNAAVFVECQAGIENRV